MTFVVWGLMQGIFLSIEALIKAKRTSYEKKYSRNSRIIYTLGCIITIYILFTSSQIFGRSANINDAFLIYRKIFTEHGAPYLDLTTLAYASAGLLLVIIKDFTEEYFAGSFQFLTNRRAFVRYCSYLAILFLILLFGVFNGSSFIYFQF
jgi:D-alanyl-lipoteichoic acid acyltransferase DltB (MBOAT superfamily)